ncbi:MAG: hypothetical protein ABI345_02880 [Jatrophihabitans sp.]
MSNPLIATADEPTSGGIFVNVTSKDNKGLNGAGIFYDAATTISDVSQHNWGSVAVDAAADGLDTLGLLTDPFGVLLSAPIGWIIEHIGFLKDILDVVAGDPEAVRAKAETWRNIAAALTKSANDYTRSAQALVQQSKGEAITAYSQAAGNYAKAVTGAASHAEDAAKGFEIAGAIVGTVRGIIRDTIAQFAADELIEGLIALAASWCTFGGSIAAWVIATVEQATSMAVRNAAKVTRLVKDVTELVGAAKTSSRALESAERDLAKGTREVGDAEHAAGTAERSAKRGEHRSNAERTSQRHDDLDKIRKANKDRTNAEQKLGAANRQAERAQQAEDRAAQHLHDAKTPAQREQARNEMWNAEARRRTHEQQAEDARTQIEDAGKASGEARTHYRETYTHDITNESEAQKKIDEALKELGLQSKESNNNYGDAGDEAANKAGEINDGSLVPSE